MLTLSRTIQEIRRYLNGLNDQLSYYTVPGQAALKGFTSTEYMPILSKVHLNKIFECKIAIIFVSVSFNKCFGCSKEQSQ